MEVVIIRAAYDAVRRWSGMDRATFVQEGDHHAPTWGAHHQESSSSTGGAFSPLNIAIAASVFMGVFASILSWRSNLLAGWNVVMRVLFALVAFLFGTVYLVQHVLLKADLVSQIYRLQGGFGGVQPLLDGASAAATASRPLSSSVPLAPKLTSAQLVVAPPEIHGMVARQ